MFKEIPGYEGLYEINEYGEVKGLKMGKMMHIQNPSKNYAYKSLILTKNNKQKRCGIHRLVAQTFLPNPDNLPVVMHKDNNKLNNHVSNLEWGTHSDNNLQSYRDWTSTTSRSSKVFYEIYKDDGSVHEICEGHTGIEDKADLRPTGINSIIQNNRLIKEGPFKGCRIKRIKFENET